MVETEWTQEPVCVCVCVQYPNSDMYEGEGEGVLPSHGTERSTLLEHLLRATPCTNSFISIAYNPPSKLVILV